jgi:hypothetical protein
LEVSPSKRQVNIALSNQSALSSVIMISFWCYSGVVLVILLFICHSSILFMLCILFISGVLHIIFLYLEFPMPLVSPNDHVKALSRINFPSLRWNSKVLRDSSFNSTEQLVPNPHI